MKYPGTNLRAVLAGFLSNTGISICEISYGTIQSLIGQHNEPPALTGAEVDAPQVPASLHHSLSLLQRQHLLRKSITCVEAVGPHYQCAPYAFSGCSIRT